MSKNYKVIFEVKGLKGSPFDVLNGLEEIMGAELMRVYNIYSKEANSGITDELNAEFDQLYPNYFEDNKEKEWYDLVEYNQFIAIGYQKKIIDKFNSTNESPILEFYMEPKELVFTGKLKNVVSNITISFYLKEV